MEDLLELVEHLLLLLRRSLEVEAYDVEKVLVSLGGVVLLLVRVPLGVAVLRESFHFGEQRAN